MTSCARVLSLDQRTASPAMTSTRGVPNAAKPIETPAAAGRARPSAPPCPCRASSRARGAAASASAASGGAAGRDDLPRSSARHPVDADHARPSCAARRGSGRATCPGSSSRQRTRKLSAGPTVCVSRGVPSGAIQRWPWTWKVWCSEPIAITSHWTSSPTLEREDGRVADERAAVDRLERAHRRRRPPRTRGRAPARGGRGSRASRTCRRRSRRPSTASGRGRARRRRESLPARQPVGPGLAGLDVGVAAGEAGQVGAVGARLVVDAVEVHGVRALERVSMFLKWTT